MTAVLDATVDRVVAALVDAGPSPFHHYRRWSKLRSSWPTLAEALYDLIAVRQSELRP